jgi:dienelactone hydrolase
MKLRWTLSACLLAGVFAHAQKIGITPNPVMTDETTEIRVTEVPAAGHVTIRAELVDGGGQAWASEAEFVADTQGTIEVAKQAPVKGSYRTNSAMGLIWSMRPIAKDVHQYEPPHNLEAQVIHFHLLQGGKETASARLEQLPIREGVREIHVEGALHGVFFVPAGVDKHAGVLVLGGSEGGMPMRRAAWLASHGFAAFALCYFHCEGRPVELQNIDLEYFAQALSWMMQRPEVAGDRLAVMGTSRGGELALQVGSMYPQIRAVAAYVPANVRYPACCGQSGFAAWTWQGQALAWANPRQRNNAGMMIRAAISVEHTHGPILVIGGEDDGVWPSAEMVDAVATRLRQAHFKYACIELKYPHAGHRAGMPEIDPSWHGGVVHPLTGKAIELGGTPEGNAQSSLDAIPKVLAFLDQSLSAGGEPSSAEGRK